MKVARGSPNLFSSKNVIETVGDEFTYRCVRRNLS